MGGEQFHGREGGEDTNWCRGSRLRLVGHEPALTQGSGLRGFSIPPPDPLERGISLWMSRRRVTDRTLGIYTGGGEKRG